MNYKHNVKLCKYVWALALLFLVGCGEKDAERPRPDVSHIDAEVDVIRFESMLYEADANNMIGELKSLQNEHSVFFDCYRQMLRIPPDSNVIYAAIEERLAFGGMRAAYDSVMLKYPDLEALEAQLTEGMRYTKYYFPQLPEPKVYTFTSEYGFGVVACSDTVYGIGLDLFLGKDFTFYPAVDIPNYLLPRLEPEYIAPTFFRQYFQQYFPEPPANHLLDLMIHRGKMLYLIELVLPDAADHLIISYSEPEMEWVREHEGELWAFLLGEELLYETTAFTYRKYLEEGPGTPSLPQQAPAKVAVFSGWQIVREFMANNEGVSLERLMTMDAQYILENANYKPER